MDSLPPDPYIALGVAKDAPIATIKTSYRKLALKFHPDKVQDEAQKPLAADQFHKIQSAWEIVSDETRRQRYDAQVRLAELKRDVLARRDEPRRSPPETRTASFAVPTQTTPRGAEFYARGPERFERASTPTYEERRPSHAAQDGYFDFPPRATSRKDADYERTSKRSTQRGERDRPRPSAKQSTKESSKQSAKQSKESTRSSRKEKNKRNDRDIDQERARKQSFVVDPESDDGVDDRDRVRRSSRDDEDVGPRRRRQDEVDVDEPRPRRGEYYEQPRRRSDETVDGYFVDDRARKLTEQQEAQREYIQSANQSAKSRPEAERRTSSAREKTSKSDAERPIPFRRGSSRPQTTTIEPELRRPSSRRRSTESLDGSADQWQPPLFRPMASAPTEGRSRSYSVQVAPDEMPMPSMRRAETMPVEPRSSRGENRRGYATTPNRPSGLHHMYPTPEQSPERSPKTAAPTSSRRQRFTDPYDSPDEYPPEVREPSRTNSRHAPPRHTTSPPPYPDRSTRQDRERDRAISPGRVPSPNPPRPSPVMRTASASAYPVRSGSMPDIYPRPTPSREGSSRPLYKDGRTAAPASTSARSPRTSAFPEDVQYAAEYRPENLRMQANYNLRRDSAPPIARPAYSRTSSSSTVRVR